MSEMAKRIIVETAKNDLSLNKHEHYTASELIRSANICRSTFYYNFSDGLIGVISYTFHLEIIEPLNTQCLDWSAATVFILQYCQQHKTMVKNSYLIYGGMRCLSTVRYQLFVLLVHNQEVVKKSKLNFSERQYLHLLCNALITEIQCWACNNFEESVDEIECRLLMRQSSQPVWPDCSNSEQKLHSVDGLVMANLL